MELTIIEADLGRPEHQEAVLHLVDEYSKEPMGDGKPLSETARKDLIPGLRGHPTTMVFVAFHDDKPAGLALCFRGFSTFAARTLLNIHDFFVMPRYQGTGVGRRLLAAVEERARELGYCKLTLEVVEKNHRARRVYAAAGFVGAPGGLEGGVTFFLSKRL
ncbi:MAG: putative acetyltransferase [Verrucomicrobiales bacterium]|nr:putative acetyltransferase [Verrucomicrobiales bacterium]